MTYAFHDLKRALVADPTCSWANLLVSVQELLVAPVDAVQHQKLAQMTSVGSSVILAAAPLLIVCPRLNWMSSCPRQGP